ncbi:hypothetical protein KGF54_000769 [Candida jiufengensis]|uniref:uncharacterized protein n=1 Tax=Candida jiufengensis TaxID=497108 RepID=UPI002224B966|nr:uncharacterized protein KGF54_000769 [Candida jiufengensis]KAI5956294.1 hypothetical protein KGF54_000769 [Candida jiufengensis]
MDNIIIQVLNDNKKLKKNNHKLKKSLKIQKVELDQMRFYYTLYKLRLEFTAKKLFKFFDKESVDKKTIDFFMKCNMSNILEIKDLEEDNQLWKNKFFTLLERDCCCLQKSIINGFGRSDKATRRSKDADANKIQFDTSDEATRRSRDADANKIQFDPSDEATRRSRDADANKIHFDPSDKATRRSRDADANKIQFDPSDKATRRSRDADAIEGHFDPSDKATRRSKAHVTTRVDDVELIYRSHQLGPWNPLDPAFAKKQLQLEEKIVRLLNLL